MNGWCVLKTSTGRYLGQKWEVMNTALRRPRLALVGLQEASVFPASQWQEDARRGHGVLGVEFRPVAIKFKDRLNDKGRRVGVDLESQETIA